MRITVILGPSFPVPPVLGGAVEKAHLLLAEAYVAAGHQVTMISRQYLNFPVEETANGVTHLRVPSESRAKSTFANLAATLRYSIRVARRLPPSDITVTNSFFLPLVLSRKRAGKIYVHVARFPKHQMFLYSRADRLQSISKAVAQAVLKQTPWLARKVVTIGYPVPKVYFQPAETRRQQTILFVGRIAREKGVHLLIQALRLIAAPGKTRSVDPWKLLIVGPHEIALGGDGPDYLNELRKLAEPLGSMCEFAGPVFDESKLAGIYQSSSIFVYPSLAQKGEAFGLAPLEAMAAGCAVVVSSLPCFDDFVEDGKNALKFGHACPRPETNLADKLLHLITNPNSLATLAHNGAVTARQFLSPAIGARMLADFALLLKERAS